MATKHFHGRRHIRAQWRVRIIRQRKQEKKINRDVEILQSLFSNYGLINAVQNSLIDMVQGISNLVPVMRAAVESSLSFQFPPEARARFIKQIREIQGELDESKYVES